MGDKMDLEDKINRVKEILADRKVAIGFSGGADSTLLAYLSSKVSKDTLAITINNHLLPTDFIENTKQSANEFGIKHQIIDMDFYENDSFLSNSTRRCYDCREMMYDNIEKTALEKGFDFICDGNNISDLVVDRPGILITYKKNFKTPFIEANLSSKEIHRYLDENNIYYSKSTTCLATRIPTNTMITKEKIEKIRLAEDYIQNNTGCRIVKVRQLKNYALCEVDDLGEILNSNSYEQINSQLKKYGFEKVALNLEAIDDDEYISIEYENGSFSYQLPYTINISETKKQFKNRIVNISKDKIELDNISISENGLIQVNNLKTYEIAVNRFMEILPKIRRNI